MCERIAEALVAQCGPEIIHGFLGRFLHRMQTCPHQVEIQAVGDQPERDLLHAIANICDAFGSERVGAQVTGCVAFQQLRRFLQTLEEQRHRVRVEAGLLQQVDADAVCFFFMLAGEVELALHHAALRADDAGLRRIGIAACSQDGDRDSGHRRQGVIFLSGHHARQMMLGDVRDLVAQYGCEFRFALCQQDQSRVDADESAGHGEGVDRAIIDHEEFEGFAGLAAVGDQPAAKAVQVIGDLRIVEILLAGADLEHALFADLALHLRRDHGLRDVSQIG